MAGVDTSALMSCSYGSAGFMLTKLTMSDDARTAAGQGRVGTDVVFAGEGFIDDTTPASYYSKLAAVQAAFAQDGQNFSVTGLSGATLFSLGASQCLDGGPQCSFAIQDGVSPCHSIVRFTLKARLNTPLGQTFKSEVLTHPDGRLTLHQTGTFSGVAASSGYDAALAAFQAAYAPPNWVVNFQFTENLAGTQIEYSFSADQCTTPLPAQSATTYAVEGETVQKQEIDEQQKLTTTWDYDYQIVGNPLIFWTYILSGFADQVIFRTSFSTTYRKGYRVKASVMTVGSADGSSFIFWQQTVRIAQDQAQYEEATYPGASPLAILKPETLGRITQTGSAVGVGQTVPPPSAIPSLLSKLPEIGYESVDAVQRRTTWSYEGYAVDANGNPIAFNPNVSQRP